MREEAGQIILSSKGSEGLFRYFCTQPFTDDVRVDFEFSFRKRPHELSVWLNTAQPGGELNEAGYRLLVLPGKARTLSLLRSGRMVAGARSPEYERRRWYRGTVSREHDRFSLKVDGEELYAYRDPIPLTGGFLGITGQSDLLFIRNLSVYSRGTSVSVSCLALPDAFFNRELYEDARAGYDRIAARHPGRSEGRVAVFRSGLCFREMARREDDGEVRSFLLSEAREAFSTVTDANDSCLSALGRAMVAAEEGDLLEKRAALAAAFQEYPGDPHRPVVREWLLGRLHALGRDQRRVLAKLLPIAMSHCMGDSAYRLIGTLVRELRRRWEIPSFMISRGSLKERDPVSYAEAKLFFGFWAASSDLLEETVIDLTVANGLRPHHLSDVIFAILELG